MPRLRRSFSTLGPVLSSRRDWRAGGGFFSCKSTAARTFTDERALLVAGQPEVREYRARYWDRGIANGAWSDVQKMTVAP